MAGLVSRAAGAAMLAAAVILPWASGPSGQAAPDPPIPAGLLAQARPIGVGPRFQPPVTGPVTGRCGRSLGRRTGVHVEVFAANRVVILPAGIGTRPPRGAPGGRITSARCYGALVTLDPTGLVLVRPGSALTAAALFRSWGQPLSRAALAAFRAPRGGHVTVYVNGQPWRGSPGTVPLSPHAEIVLETGPHVPPHRSYTFPPGS